ncbi:hypothetical protein [Brevibacillus brevis]|uniref:ABC transporter ATP-binding protein n=1 Tax=Brevibacillus brevis TaxID=1393 RepID=UPI003D1E763D
MYRGRIVELAESNRLYENPIHPYTKSLLSAIPLPDPDYERNRKRIVFDDQEYLRDQGEERVLREIERGPLCRLHTKKNSKDTAAASWCKPIHKKRERALTAHLPLLFSPHSQESHAV